MRLLFGMIVGAAATIGLAYVHDSMYATVSFAPPSISAEPRPMVNWDVASSFARRTSAAAREQWDKLSGK
jgi:hypothetical protein